ncbi:type IV secretory system conjugative DNA transfer family protein [Agromyces neolithicus]|uniref:TraD/TraG TraM recognition site domain-containing protein n=1 Tax=Agromyces neolithicus TaxID=269420 RepID=A0ABN2MDI4_9MICO
MAVPGRTNIGGSPWPLLAVLGVGVLVLVDVWGAFRLAHTFNGSADNLPSDPFLTIAALVHGQAAWPTTATILLVGFVVVELVAAIVLGVMFTKNRGKRSRVDDASRYMGRGRDLDGVSLQNAAAFAKRVGIEGDVKGVFIGESVSGAQPLYSSWEDVMILIAGPRTGKSTSFAIPQIVEAPGSVLVTSNKRDVVDATRDIRAQHGDVWVFDPQAIALEEPVWWWNPLSYVTDEVKAAKLAEHFAAGSRTVGGSSSDYFDNAGQNLLADLLLAAALSSRPITDVYLWTTRPADETPAEILEEHNYTLQAARLFGAINLPDKQRGGIYGTAAEMASCLTNRQVARWVTPQSPADPRPQFDPQAFVQRTDSLYSLSKEGRGSAGPLVTALTVAVCEAAEELASRSSYGRLAKPLLCILDEAANVCRWRELPNLYSHYGSRGIIPLTILQSWSQGVDVWGESGMRKLWSAANIAIYGGSVKEKAFLEDLSSMVGDYERVVSSTSTGRGQRTVSQQSQRERILDVADLAAMPKGRALVLSSGNRPALIRTRHWARGSYKEQIEASILAHDPAAAQTIAGGEAELVANEHELASKEAA